MKTFSSYNLGCKVNLYELEALSSMLRDEGFEQVSLSDSPEIILVNTCSVTKQSDSKSQKQIRMLRRNNPKAVLIGLGCYIQNVNNSLDDKLGLGLDIIMATNKKSQIVQLLKEKPDLPLDLPLVYSETDEGWNCYDELVLKRLSTHSRGFVKIQDGCQNYCTYCIVPYVRGPIKSRDPVNVIDEMKRLVSCSVREIVVSGINTGSYGKDLGDLTLTRLIERIISEVDGLFRLRISSLELKEITDELIDLYRREKVLVDHFHIPLQSGCDSVLKRMNRKYTTSEYLSTIEKIRRINPDVAITTDCLAGFVGETEEEWKSTLDFVKRVGFSQVHVFPYSPRVGSEAFLYKGHLNPKTIKTRASELLEVAKELNRLYSSNYLDTIQTVLFEQEKDGYWFGKTSNYLEVGVKYSEFKDNPVNQLYQVKLLRLHDGWIEGELRKESL